MFSNEHSSILVGGYIMPSNGPRKRVRITPLPPLNKVLAGVRETQKMSTGEITSTLNLYTSINNDLLESETTVDFLHDGPPYLSGGPFSCVKIRRPHFDIKGHVRLLGGWTNINHTHGYFYNGGFYNPLWVPSLDTLTDAQALALSDSYSAHYPDLTAIGSGAYDRLRPQIGGTGLSVAIAEMRELPRMLSTTARGFHDAWSLISRSSARSNSVRMAPKKSANHFLNHQFGWVPFLRDVSRLYDTYSRAPQLSAQISRDNNTWIKRRRVDKLIESDTLVYSRTDVPGVQPTGSQFQFYVPGSYLYTIRRQEITNVWYEGSWKYYRPEFDVGNPKYDSLFNKVRRMQTLYGAEISPTFVWNVTPWSWLVDWFSNAGDAIQRAEDWGSDKLVSRYMYLMHHHTYRFELRARFSTTDGAAHDYIWYRYADIKRREPASTPFQFSLSGALTPRQLAILGAIGLSR